MKKLAQILILILVFGGFQAQARSVHASTQLDDTRQNVKDERDAKKTELEQKKEQLKEETQEQKQTRCEALTQTIQTKISNYEENKQAHLTKYAEIKEKVETIIEKLKAKGVDTSKVEADLVTFDSMAQSYATLYDNFVDLLKQSQTLVCGASDGAFRQAIQVARNMQVALAEKRLELRDYYLNVLRKDLLDLRGNSIDGKETRLDKSKTLN